MTIAVVEAASRADGRDPMDLEPLQSVVDPDSLNSLFSPQSTTTQWSNGHVTFQYEGYDVAIEAGGRITLVARE